MSHSIFFQAFLPVRTGQRNEITATGVLFPQLIYLIYLYIEQSRPREEVNFSSFSRYFFEREKKKRPTREEKYM